MLLFHGTEIRIFFMLKWRLCYFCYRWTLKVNFTAIFRVWIEQNSFNSCAQITPTTKLNGKDDFFTFHKRKKFNLICGIKKMKYYNPSVMIVFYFCNPFGGGAKALSQHGKSS